MSNLLAIDVAVLPPPDVTTRAIELSASLPADSADRLQLDAQHLPHVTLAQFFVREGEIDTAFDRIGAVVAPLEPLPLQVTGAGRSSGSAVWLAIERTPELVAVHEQVMEAVRGIERPDGGPSAFADEGRVADVLWVAGYRLKSSFGSFTPHITLGRAEQPPAVEPFAFEASTIAVCHLGRFCTCRSVLRRWTLGHAAAR